MIRRFALWLAELTDSWAHTAAHDDGPEQLARAEESFDCWEVDQGTLIDRTILAPVIYLDEVDLAVRRHPAGKRR